METGESALKISRESSSIPSEITTSEQPHPKFVLSRRQFIAMLTSTAALGAASYLSGNIPVNAASAEKTLDSKLSQNKEEKQKRDEAPLLKTLEEQGLLVIGKAVTLAICRKIGIPIKIPKTNSDEITRQLLMEKPLKSFLNIAILGPAVEEGLFRLIPSLFFNRPGWDLSYKHGESTPVVNINFWEVGIPTSALFALAHNVESDGKDNIKLNMKTIPLTQFAQGVFFWYVMRNRGIGQAILTHMANNGILLGSWHVANFLSKVFPGKSSKKTELETTKVSK